MHKTPRVFGRRRVTASPPLLRSKPSKRTGDTVVSETDVEINSSDDEEVSASIASPPRSPSSQIAKKPRRRITRTLVAKPAFFSPQEHDEKYKSLVNEHFKDVLLSETDENKQAGGNLVIESTLSVPNGAVFFIVKQNPVNTVTSPPNNWRWVVSLAEDGRGTCYDLRALVAVVRHHSEVTRDEDELQDVYPRKLSLAWPYIVVDCGRYTALLVEGWHYPDAILRGTRAAVSSQAKTAVTYWKEDDQYLVYDLSRPLTFCADPEDHRDGDGYPHGLIEQGRLALTQIRAVYSSPQQHDPLSLVWSADESTLYGAGPQGYHVVEYTMTGQEDITFLHSGAPSLRPELPLGRLIPWDDDNKTFEPALSCTAAFKGHWTWVAAVTSRITPDLKELLELRIWGHDSVSGKTVEYTATVNDPLRSTSPPVLTTSNGGDVVMCYLPGGEGGHDPAIIINTNEKSTAVAVPLSQSASISLGADGLTMMIADPCAAPRVCNRFVVTYASDPRDRGVIYGSRG